MGIKGSRSQFVTLERSGNLRSQFATSKFKSEGVGPKRILRFDAVTNCDRMASVASLANETRFAGVLAQAWREAVRGFA